MQTRAISPAPQVQYQYVQQQPQVQYVQQQPQVQYVQQAAPQVQYVQQAAPVQVINRISTLEVCDSRKMKSPG